uniref:Rho termination factor N-terminal domain-containing protein n=1 Tax=viral metagenome TaxID=1070528 RepID=A0A6C0EEV8_9ZZZZ
MAITDIFSTSLLISLAICLLLVGSVFMYFNQKIADQNHKITSMFDLVSTMAEEVNSVKYHVQMVASRVGIPMGMQPPQQQTQTQPPVMNGGVVNSFNTNSNLITISEDEEDDDEDSDDEDEEDDDDEDDEDNEDDEDDEDDDDEDDDDEENSDDQDIKINEEDEDLDSENFDNLNFEAVADSALNESDMKNLKTININISSNDNDNDNEEEIEIESEDVSDVNIKNVEVLDYKKLSLNKLRSIVTEKGMVTDASKLKKHELLKLLEVE